MTDCPDLGLLIGGSWRCHLRVVFSEPNGGDASLFRS